MFNRKIAFASAAAFAVCFAVAMPARAASPTDVAQIAAMVKSPAACGVHVGIPGENIGFEVGGHDYAIAYVESLKTLSIVATTYSDKKPITAYYKDVGLTGKTDDPAEQAGYDDEVGRIVRGTPNCAARTM